MGCQCQLNLIKAFQPNNAAKKKKRKKKKEKDFNSNKGTSRNLYKMVTEYSIQTISLLSLTCFENRTYYSSVLSYQAFE